MTYKYLVVNDRPDGAWGLDSYPFVDHAGNKRAATGKRLNGYPGPAINFNVDEPPVVGTYSQTVELAPSLVSSTGPAVRVSPANPLVLDFGLMSHGNESQPFTLECWFRAEKVTTLTTIMGHEGSDSGITFDGDAIRFTVNYTASGSSEVEYYPVDTTKTMYVVAVHTSGYNRLYIDGVMVGESLLTAEQRQDSYSPVTNDEVIVSGYSTDNTSRVIIDFPATYAYDLRTDKIVNHYIAGRRTDNYYRVIESYGATYWTLDDNTTEIVRADSFSSYDEWNQGVLDNATGASDSLIPETDDEGDILPGSWKWGYILDLGTVISSSKIEWDSDGAVVVESSVDNEATWQTAVNGRGISNITNLTESISLRVRFTGEGLVRSLKFTTYSDITMPAHDGTRFLQWSGSVSPGSSAFVPIDQSSLGRLETYSGAGLITASNLPNGLEGMRSVEMWIKVDPGTNTKYILHGGTFKVWLESSKLRAEGCTVFVNGAYAPTESQFTRGAWQHVVIVFAAATTNAVWVLGSENIDHYMNALLGHLAVYPTALTATQIADIYGSYLGFETIQLLDDNNIAITEPAGELKIYSFNWSVRTAA